MKVASWTAVPCTLQLPRVINLRSPSQNMPRPFQLEGGKRMLLGALSTHEEHLSHHQR